MRFWVVLCGGLAFVGCTGGPGLDLPFGKEESDTAQRGGINLPAGNAGQQTPPIAGASALQAGTTAGAQAAAGTNATNAGDDPTLEPAAGTAPESSPADDEDGGVELPDAGVDGAAP